MKHYRIVEKSDINGQIKFFPQHRWLCFWLPYFKGEMIPTIVSYDCKESSIEFLENQKKHPKTKFYYF